MTAGGADAVAAGTPPGRRVRVLFFHHGSVAGGAPVSLANLVRGLADAEALEFRIACINEAMTAFFRSRTAAEVVTVPDPGVSLGKVMVGWAPLWRAGTLARLPAALVRLPAEVRRVALWLERERPDIVHLNSATLVTVALAARRTGIPCVWHVREINLGRRWNPRRWLAGWTIRRLADAVVAISPAEARSLGPDRRGNVHVVYNFVDESTFRAASMPLAQARREIGLPVDARVIASLGGVSFRKGAWQLVESLQRLPTDVHLVIAGPAPSRSLPGRRVRWMAPWFLRLEDLLVSVRLRDYHLWYYAERVRRSCLQAPQGRVHFTGVVDDVRPVLAACDVLVFAGTTPHFPRPVYEAWMMERPAVVFDVPGVRDNVEHGVDGLVASPLTAAALADAVRTVLDDPAGAAAMARAGHEKAMTRFTMGPSVQRVREIYAAVTRRRRPVPGAGSARERTDTIETG